MMLEFINTKNEWWKESQSILKPMLVYFFHLILFVRYCILCVC